MRAIHIVPRHKFAETQADGNLIAAYLRKHGECSKETIVRGCGLTWHRYYQAMKYLRRDRQIITVSAPGAGSVYGVVK